MARVAGTEFDFSRSLVERSVETVEPEPIREHYVVVGGRRYPPKQVLARVTGLARADFTTHQARAVLRRLRGHGRSARVWRIPSTSIEAGSAVSAP